MKHIVRFLCTIAVASSFAAEVAAQEVGKKAPNFKLPAVDGKNYELKDFRGKTVVLEWINYGCPYVQKHYNSGNMPRLQAKFTEKGIVWLSINSSAPGKQGNYSIKKWKEMNQKKNNQATAVLLDESGKVGRKYGAKTTPHMYIVDKKGILRYNGAIDDKPTTQLEDVKTAHNYVAVALDALDNKKPVPEKSTRPYGCSVKY